MTLAHWPSRAAGFLPLFSFQRRCMAPTTFEGTRRSAELGCWSPRPPTTFFPSRPSWRPCAELKLLVEIKLGQPTEGPGRLRLLVETLKYRDRNALRPGHFSAISGFLRQLCPKNHKFGDAVALQPVEFTIF